MCLNMVEEMGNSFWSFWAELLPVARGPLVDPNRCSTGHHVDAPNNVLDAYAVHISVISVASDNQVFDPSPHSRGQILP